MLLALLLACTGATPNDTADTTDTSDTTGGDTDNAACDTLNSGTNWVFNGECPQMRTPCDMVVDSCALTIDYTADGGMTMGMPYAGTIAGNTITFEDGDSITGCVGTIEDADTVSGSCDGGCTFTLSR
jgi:hypothetical protein